jgi:glycosyltransferase involved in cell wall biosynthesis
LVRLCHLANLSVIHALRWVTAFAQRGYEVHLVSMSPLRYGLPKNVVLYSLPFPAPWGYWANAPWLRMILARVRPQLLHVHYAAGYGVLGRLSGFHPRILSIWGSDVFVAPYQSGFQRRVIQKNLRSYDMLCATGNAIAQQARSVCDGLGDIRITPFGVDTEKFRPNPTKKDASKITIGTVKKYHPFYGIDLLVRAFARVRQRFLESEPEIGRRLRLLLVGSGDHKAEIEALVKSLGISDVSEVLGPVPHHEVPDYLNRLDVYACPSRSESFGVAVLEASACGVPVVVTNVGGLPEVVEDGKTGFIVPPENLDALAEAIETLVRRPDLRAQMGQAGREMVAERYSWDESVRIMENVYAEAIALGGK